MNPEEASTKPEHLPLSVMQPGERIICEIKRHPIGIFGLYIASGTAIIASALIAFILAPHFLTAYTHKQVFGIAAIIFLVIALGTFIFTFISNYVYWGNSWVVTSDSITQVSQTSLFNKQSSQLSLGNLEDVTAEQDGILAHMFNYGVLRVETAGNKSKFVFPFCPNPNYYAQQVLTAREQFEQGRRGDDEQRPYRAQGAYANQPATQGTASTSYDVPTGTE
ncbi:MAG: hypothetical protein ACREGB_05560 [Candidatus Saccharimonadales bacterium]